MAVPRSCAISFRRNRNIAELGEKLRKFENPYKYINGVLVLMGTSPTNGGFSSKPCLMTLEGIVVIPSFMIIYDHIGDPQCGERSGIQVSSMMCFFFKPDRWLSK